nr:MAG TPA: hypothetical protein [Caudoviricetes sp.]
MYKIINCTSKGSLYVIIFLHHAVSHSRLIAYRMESLPFVF